MEIVKVNSNTQILRNSSKDTAMNTAYFTFSFLTIWSMIALSFPDRYLTHSREPLITQAPQIDDHPLFARGDVSTCGYVSGNAKSPLTCPPSYSCTSTVQDLVGWACCDQIQCAGNYYTCVDYGAQLCGGLDAAGCSSTYTSILSCSSAAPSCFSYARTLSLGDQNTYFSLACGQSSGSVLALQTSLAGNSPAAATAATAAPTVFGQSNPSSSSTDGSSPTESTSSTLSAADKAGIGIAAGGVVVAFVGVLVALMVGWWKKHQVLWFFTCGRRGYKRSMKPPSAQAWGHPLTNMGNGGAPNNGGGNLVTNVGRWGNGGRP